MGWEWLRHAFAIPGEAEFVPGEAQRDLVERVCRATVAHGLATPAALFLETVRPLHFPSAQVLHFFSPLAGGVCSIDLLNQLALMLEHPGAIEYMLHRLELAAGGAAAPPPPVRD